MKTLMTILISMMEKWIALVNHWMNEKSKRQKDPAKKNPHRAVVYVHTHKHKSDKNINGHVNINLTTVEDNSSEDVMAIRLQMEKLERHVENNDAELLQLKEKATKLEKAQKNQGGLDGASTNKEAICDDIPNSKRRRVYGDNPSQEICMFEEGNIMDQQDNSLMNTQSHVHDENLQPPTKHSTVYKNTQSLGQNHSGKQRKITSCANKRKGNLDQNELMQPGKSISSAYKNKENLTRKLVRPSLNKYSTASKKRQCNTMDFLTDNSTVKVYGDGPLQEICHVEQENIVMNSQSHVQDEDKTPPTKHATAHKNKRTFGLNDHGKQMEIICAKNKKPDNQDSHMVHAHKVGGAYKVVFLFTMFTNISPFKL
ncbi:hypothetical protein DAI22_11g179850 [Oryza sativa Japonica Group]|nr:hypothetical protein DAI22_11g179850 [Oryza sativa Japonica Group]